MKAYLYLWSRVCAVGFALFCFAAGAQTYLITDVGKNTPGGVNNGGIIASSSYIANQAVLYTNHTEVYLGTLGGPLSHGYALNNFGSVVGDSEINSTTTYHAFRYTNGVMSDLGTLWPSSSSANSYAYGINDTGQVCGYSEVSGGGTRAFRYTNGVMSNLGTLGGVDSRGLAINASGQIVGYSSTTGSSPTFACRWNSGTNITNLGVLSGGTGSYGYGINDAGHVVGYCTFSSAPIFRAFLHNGSMSSLGTLVSGNYSIANAINNSDQIVGYAAINANTNHAFLYDSINGMRDLNNLVRTNSGWTLNIADAINNTGQIVGTGTTNGQSHGFLLTPQALLGASKYVSNTGFRFSITNALGRTNTIQFSTNLTNWTTLTNVVDTNTVMQFIDSAATNSPRRFYRTFSP